MIKSFVNANASNWDLYVNLLLAAYRSSPHPATGFTPNLMMLGREINIPKNILLSECSTKEREGIYETLYHTAKCSVESLYHPV
jgi:hypothetical protein